MSSAISPECIMKQGYYIWCLTFFFFFKHSRRACVGITHTGIVPITPRIEQSSFMAHAGHFKPLSRCPCAANHMQSLLQTRCFQEKTANWII